MKLRKTPLFLALTLVAAVQFLTESWAQEQATAMARKIVIHCEEAGALFECKVKNVNPVPGAPPEPAEPIENMQTISVGYATGAEADIMDEGSQEPIKPDHLKHCWVQLPNGQWQLYHC